MYNFYPLFNKLMQFFINLEKNSDMVSIWDNLQIVFVKWVRSGILNDPLSTSFSMATPINVLTRYQLSLNDIYN